MKTPFFFGRLRPSLSLFSSGAFLPKKWGVIFKVFKLMWLQTRVSSTRFKYYIMLWMVIQIIYVLFVDEIFGCSRTCKSTNLVSNITKKSPILFQFISESCTMNIKFSLPIGVTRITFTFGTLQFCCNRSSSIVCNGLVFIPDLPNGPHEYFG